ncbi:MAG: malto-oligosyltrehalose synthase [PVC group bacterium]|nr:malto-oligosyltrehalose synthase [PVC group bacterium]
MKTPLATYRIQFNPSFGFQQAKEVLDYLKALGISDIYASPIFKARKGSGHGYDIVDSNQINPELGTEADFDALSNCVTEKHMGWLQDIVPNHMAFDAGNKMLMDVLEMGRCSEYYEFFDINWNHPYESMRGRLLAPFLGRFYAECLESGEIELTYNKEGLSVNYYSLRFPLKIESYSSVLGYRIDKLANGSDKADDLIGIFSSLGKKAENRYSQLAQAKKDFWELYIQDTGIKEFIDENVRTFNGSPGDPESFNLLDELLGHQWFRLAFWKVAAEEINYRRFFTINELICLKIDDQDVLNQTHALIIKLVEEGKITGLRIDHIDGLQDPRQYLERLKGVAKDTYTVVEKILIDKEQLSLDWPAQGTTGYDFLNHANGLFCMKKNQRSFNRIYTKFTGRGTSYEGLACNKKRLIISKHMAGNIDNLAVLLKQISSYSRHGSDITLYALRRALVEVLAHFPVYRTYISHDDFTDIDADYILSAVKKAKHISPGLFYELDFIEKFLLLKPEHYIRDEEREKVIEFVMRFQQVSGPLMAKGVEDTVFYVYNRFLSLNEVGGSPDKFGIFVKDFHNFNKTRQANHPCSLNALSTHDTKRGEDFRARLNVFSEIPELWEQSIKRWNRSNKKIKTKLNAVIAPDKNDEYFLYQTLAGAFPFNVEDRDAFMGRLKEYLIKAVREAKVYTAWLKPDTDYENAYIKFAEEIMNGAFLNEFLPFQKKIAYYGIFNSLVQTLIKMTAPGVPDFYQGTELWDLSLVDPDNRRPVDFVQREKMLRDIMHGKQNNLKELILDLWKNKEDGRVKMFLIYQILQQRKALPELFLKGDYAALDTGGKYKDHVVAFARTYKDDTALIIVPRFLTTLVEEGENPFGETVWSDTYVAVPDGVDKWTDAITDQVIEGKRTLAVSDIFKSFPGAMLINK